MAATGPAMGGQAATLDPLAGPARQAAPADPLAGALRQTLAPSDVHVLLVDDERLSRVVVGNVLRKCNYRVTIAESGTEAVNLLRANSPDTFQLVLTDVMMPDVDGIDLLRFLRSNDAFAAVPVVMMSANEQNDTVFECIRGGAEDYLLKPVTRKEVQHIWQHVWRRQQQLVVPSIPDEGDDLRRESGQASVPTAVVDLTPPAVAAAAQGIQGAAAQEPEPSQAAQQQQQQQQQLRRSPEPTLQGSPRAAVVTGTLPSVSQHWQQQQLARAEEAPQLPPSRPLADFLKAGARARSTRRGDSAFRVLCQVLGFLRAAHARRAALGRLRPSGLRITASCVILMDPAADIPPEEEALYAAPEELPEGRADSIASAASATGDAAADSDAPAAAEQPQPARTTCGDMFSLGLLLLQLLHPPTAQDPQRGSGDAGVTRMLRDARHQILPNTLLQGRPVEAALLTALLSPDPARRPVIDDILRSGMLRQLHAGLTSPPQAPAAPSAIAGPGAAEKAASGLAAAATAAAAPAQAGGVAAAQSPALPQPPATQRQLQGPPSAQANPQVDPRAQIELAPAASLGGNQALQDFLRLARESVLAESLALQQQLSTLDEDAASVQRCLDAVAAHAPARPDNPAAQAAAAEQAARLMSPAASPQHPSSDAPAAAAGSNGAAPGSRKRSRADDGQTATPAAMAAAADAVPAALEGTVPDLTAGRPGVKAQRVAKALHAVEAAFFRAHSAAHRDAADGVDAASEKVDSPTTSKRKEALQPWRAGTAALEQAARLPPHLAAFGRDLEAFSSYGSFRVAANLKYGDGLAAPDMVCSTAFDRDDEFFATAGVSRRVKVYEYTGLLEGRLPAGAAHYPVLDLPFRAKLSCVAWNSYLKSHLLVADYEGITTLVDASVGTEVASFAEHTKRVWSVDFSATDPQRFLSGSDDGTVRLWSINEQNAVAAIDTKANVCSVQFSPTDANLMAFGAANYRTYLYDLRHIQSPLAVIAGHSRAVSYVRFLGDGRRLLTASTDNALKLWDITAEVARPQGRPSVASTTFTGHVNEKNFVGLSVTPDGYIATGSEDNSVVAYHASMPVPIARHCFSAQPPAPRDTGSAQERAMAPDAQHFVSSVAWTRGGGAAVAANSQGHLRVLQLV